MLLDDILLTSRVCMPNLLQRRSVLLYVPYHVASAGSRSIQTVNHPKHRLALHPYVQLPSSKFNNEYQWRH